MTTDEKPSSFNLRDYTSSKSGVCMTYRDMVQYQTVDYVKDMKFKYTMPPFSKYNMWDMVDRLNNIIDESDPDCEIEQIVHSYQTGERIKELFMLDDKRIKSISVRTLFTDVEWMSIPIEYRIVLNTTMDYLYSNIEDWSWFPLIGFIHDLGKVMMLEEFGSLPQWSVVGDTFPVGCKLSSNFPYYECEYWKYNNSINGSMDLYETRCGFDKIDFSWGHDEYIASFIERNSLGMPEEASYIARYHSFYSWHTPRDGNRDYVKYSNDKDWIMLPLLKAFNMADLYSKVDNIPDINKIKDDYGILIDKYFTRDKVYW